MPLRVKVFLFHLLCSVLVVGPVIAGFWWVWYPPPLGRLQGLASILLLLVIVDLVIGPVASAVVANPGKTAAALKKDIAIIVLVQVIALSYGTYTAWAARPAFIVYNSDRFDVVTASELTAERLAEAVDEVYRSVPLLGPRFAFARPPVNVAERTQLLFSAALGGADLKDFPRLYVRWEQRDASLAARVRQLDELRSVNPTRTQEIDHFVSRQRVPESVLGYFPLVGRAQLGSVIVRRDTLEILALTPWIPNY
ncbi:MAG: TfpX/TfpZ family type IV pilin accessory protein [Sutterellaceae bacterium]|nr:hypothetical protein [Burkholderiaceae bacterium]MCX7901868.1 hypothetical protein [Burkholderiaceae bacterium]MDW8429940.1 TfpX/TfpZ family type IV pilin accessory protein [Sutterellaceae bacterium]